MAGSSSTMSARSLVKFHLGDETKMMDKITIDWVGDSANGTVPTLVLQGVQGYLVQAITNPGSTGPTDNYDITLVDSEAADRAAGGLVDRDTANTEVKVFDPAPFLDGGDLTVTWANTSVNNATGRLILYVADVR